MMAMSMNGKARSRSTPTVQSFESRTRRRLETAAAGRLTEIERAELAYLWGGYESALGCKSLHGAIESRLLRSPPNDVRRLVLEELHRVGGHAPREKIVAVLAGDRLMTVYEARRAIGSLIGTGNLVADLQHHLRSRTAADGNITRELEPESMLHLPDVAMSIRADSRTRGERWRQEDEELEAYCLGGPICADEGGGAAGDRDDEQTVRKPTRALLAIQALEPLHRRALERLYGSGPVPRYVGSLGREYAAVADLTGAAEGARLKLVDVRARQDPARRAEADRQTHTSDALHAVLDRYPEGELGRKRWLDEREDFVAAVMRQGEALIVAACAAYRGELGRHV